MTKFGDRQVGVVGREAGVAGRQGGRMEKKHGGRQAGGNGGEREAWWVVRSCIDLPNILQQNCIKIFCEAMVIPYRKD